MKRIRRSEGTYQSHLSVMPTFTSICLPLLPNRLCQNRAAFLFFKLKFFIVKIESCAPSPPQTFWDILPSGKKKIKILGSSEWCVNHLGNRSVECRYFPCFHKYLSPGVTSLMWFSRQFSWEKLPMHFSVYNITQVTHFQVCDLSLNFDQNGFHLQCRSSSESWFIRAGTSWSSAGEIPCP